MGGRGASSGGGVGIDKSTGLKIGKDYGFAFNLPKGSSMIYKGGHTYKATNPQGQSKTVDSKGTTDKIKEYIGRTNIKSGSM